MRNRNEIKALINKASTQVDNGKDSAQARTDLAAELRKAGHGQVADAITRDLR